MFYDNFYSLCESKGVTPTQVARDTGIRQSTVSMWKRQGTTPKYETLLKLADYFGVSVNCLLTGEQTKKSPSEAGEGRAIDVNELRSLSKGGPLTITYEADGERIEKKFDNWQAVYDELDEEGKRQFVRIINKELDTFYSKYSKLKPDSQKRLFVYLNDLVGNPENLRIKPSTPPDKEGENNE